MDCKKALTECQGNMEEAIDWLRKKGLSAAAKKSGRVASEGLVGVATGDRCAAVVEINAETDFVARNADFQQFVQHVASVALSSPGDLTQASLPTGQRVDEALTHLIAVIGENMNVRRSQALSVSQGVVSVYIHNALAPNVGKIGVLVALESSVAQGVLSELGKKLAMHIAASHPQALDVSRVDPVMLEREKAILIDQAKATGRPADVINKMVDGRIRKYYEEIVLLEQIFVMDGKTKISDLIDQASREFGAPIVIKDFVRYALGEGIEKEQSDFAAEVRAQAGCAI